MPFVPGQFLANIKSRGGPAKSNRFEVMMTIPKIIGQNIQSPNGFLEAITNPGQTLTNMVLERVSLKDRGPESEFRDNKPEISRMLALQCDTASLPGKSFNIVEAKTYGPTFKVPTAVQYQNMSLSFICTNDFYERKLFDNWMEVIMPQDTYNFRYPRGADISENYYSTITIFQYDDFVRQVFAAILYDAFPVSISAQPLSWMDDNFHKVTVDFAYQRYAPAYEGRYDPDAIASAVIGAVGGRIQDFVGSTASDALGGVTSRIPGLGGSF